MLLRKFMHGFALCLAVATPAAIAADRIVVGNVAPLTGVIADLGKEAVESQKACFDAINARGGIRGRKIEVKVRDDGFDAERYVNAATELMEKDKVVALIGGGGTLGIDLLLKRGLLEKYQTPVIGPISGAHFNPAVTLTIRLRGELRTHEALAYIGVQILAAVVGVVLAHAMFGLPLIQPGTHVRTGHAQWLSEAVAAFGLVLTILLGMRHRSAAVPALVASYIFAAYWFTASTSFANPAVTIARSLTQTFAGIRPGDIFGFVLAQFGGAFVALFVDSRFLAGASGAASTS